MYYFLLTEANVNFAAKLNDGVRPDVLDEAGFTRYFVVYTDDRPNEIYSDGVPWSVKKIATKIMFK
jgi:hypothetical protein